MAPKNWVDLPSTPGYESQLAPSSLLIEMPDPFGPIRPFLGLSGSTRILESTGKLVLTSSKTRPPSVERHSCLGRFTYRKTSSGSAPVSHGRSPLAAIGFPRGQLWPSSELEKTATFARLISVL